MSPVDVARCGGWRGPRTLLEIYQQPDDETMLAVMEHSRKVSGER
jgi:hypothetical protein